MPNCHQCNQNIVAHGRAGHCKICLSDGVDLCQACAMWELGPLDADVDLATELRKERRVVDVQRQESEKPKTALAKVADWPLLCKVLLPTMGKVCPYFKEQIEKDEASLYGKPFAEYACDVLDKFQDLYKTCKFDRVALEILIVMHLSSQERVQCRDVKDANGSSSSKRALPVKRWQTRTIAKKHLAHHLDEIEEHFGKSIRDVVERPAWLLALGCDDLELFMKGLKHPTLMAIDLLAAAGGSAAAREALEVFTIVYHAITATRPKSKVSAHWAVTATTFVPKEALGFLSTEHFVALYGDTEVAEAFSDDMTARIEALWNVLGDASPANALPAHPRFPDLQVSGNGSLDATEKAYLQYLPVFDHPVAQALQRTPCETVVRTRVEDTIEDYLADYGPREWWKPCDLQVTFTFVVKPTVDGKTKTLRLQETLRNAHAAVDVTFGPDGLHASSALSTTAEQTVKVFAWNALTAAVGAGLRVVSLNFEITGESGNARRTARKDAMEQAIRDELAARNVAVSWRPTFVDAHGAAVANPPVAAFVDSLCTNMATRFSVDQAFDLFPAKKLISDAESGAVFTPKAWFPLKLVDVPYDDLFDDCWFDFADALPSIKEHYVQFTGTSQRPPHYMDWRNHKDLWLYDCFPIEPRRRPVFASLSTQPYLPQPNSNYGAHILYYDHAATHGRCVYTFGDKQQPRRSMLLLLDTILHGRKKKDGSAQQGVGSRRKVFQEILRRHDALTFYGHLNAQQLWQKTFAVPKTAYRDGDLLIECQIFGGVRLAADAWAVVLACEDTNDPHYIAKDHLDLAELGTATGHIAGVLPNLTVLHYRPSEVRALGTMDDGLPAWDAHLSELE